jgi:hypothetical protein
MGCETPRVATAWRLGVAILLLSSLTMAGAQQQPSAPATQPASGMVAKPASGEVKKGVYILGAVQNPGRYPLPQGRKLTIAEAVAQAGGLARTVTRPAKITILRNGTREKISVDLNKALEGKVLGVELSAGDILIVPDSVRDRNPSPQYDPPPSLPPQPATGPSRLS